jgi:hypothetical protein
MLIFKKRAVMTTKSEPEREDRSADRRDRYVSRLLSALLTLLFTVLVLVLPPIANHQLASDEKLIEKPLIAVIVALVALLAGAWLPRFAIGITILLVCAAIVQVSYYLVTTQPGRDAAGTAQAWHEVPLASGAHGIAENHPDVFGSATLSWAGSSLSLSLRSTTGTTQQGFYLNGGALGSSFYFSARVDKVEGGQAVTCPLLFGIANNRSYFTFRIQQMPDGTNEAVAYQIIPNSPSFTSGFHGLLLDQDDDIPYVGDWNLLSPSSQSHTTLAIQAQGSYYKFFVDGREVFSRQVDDIPRNTVAVGVTVLANGLSSAAVCQYDHVVLRVHAALH